MAGGNLTHMDYDDSLRWLLTLPDFERTGDFAERPDVLPMIALLHALQDPHRGRATIHIAGSKGKGSTGAMIEAVLRASGLRTGHYISPHLHRYTERIRLDGTPISRAGFAFAMSLVREAIELVSPQFPGREFVAFDVLTAAAFVAFREAHVDVQIVEVGLGGLLDSTNVFQEPGTENPEPGGDQTATGKRQRTPHIVVLTPISLEHTAILGDTVQKITRQKAGIITEGSTVIAAPQRESAIDVFAEVAARRGATLVEVAKVCQVQRTSANGEGQEFRLKTPSATYAARLPLAGRHQIDNAATAVVACEQITDNPRSPVAGQSRQPALPGRGAEQATDNRQQQRADNRQQTTEPEPALATDAVKVGLASVVWPGRLETLTRKPLVIVDGAHNGDSAKRMVAALREDFGLKSAVVLFGTLAGKDVAAMASAVAGFADAVFVSAWGSARAADPRESAAAFRPYDVPVTAFGSLAEAYDAAVAEAAGRRAVVCFGALAFVAAVREHVLGIESDALRLGLRA
jgi:dihydrofolate synthase/folylpolyglutamate synthase